jgi:hypothetical protein
MNHQRAIIQHQREVIQKAILEEKTRERQEIDQQFLEEFTSIVSRSPSCGCFAQISFDQNIGSRVAEESALPARVSQWFEILKQYEDKYSSQRQREKALDAALEAALEAINTYYPERIRSLDLQLEKLKIEYLLQVGETAAPTAIQFLRMRRGPSIPPTDIQGRAAGRLARRLYYRLFGKWPRVTKLSPYWDAMRHLHQVTEGAAARGTKDVLYVGDRSNISGTIAHLPGLHAWMSVAGLMTGGAGGGFATKFDICLCDLEFADLARFSEIQDAARRFMRPGATIIGFLMNPDAVPLPIDELAKNLSNIPGARVYYAGSTRSANLLRSYRSVLSSPRGSRLILLGNIVIRLGLLAPKTWIRNVVEALASDQRQATPPTVVTSITTEIRLPELEGDDGAIEYAKGTPR